MKLFPRSFRVSVVVITVLAITIAASVMGLTHYWTHKARSEADLAQLLRLSASESASRVAEWLKDRRESAISIAGSATLVEELRRLQHLTPQDDDYFLALYRLKKELDQNTLSRRFIHEITIHHPNTGAILLASIGEDVEVPSAEYVDRGIEQAWTQPWVSPMFAAEILLPDESKASVTGVPCMLIAAPIRDGADLYGVLRIRVRVLDIGDNLMRAADYSDMFGTSDTYIVSSAGVLLSPSHFEQQLKLEGRIRQRTMLELKLHVSGTDIPTYAFRQSRELFDSATSEGAVELSGYEGVRGQTKVGAWEKVAGTEWVCIAEIDRDEAFAPLSQLIRTNTYLSLGIGMIVVALTTWLASRVVAPLQSLAQVATRLESGDRSVRCGINRDDEIGSLATAFDSMADAVQETLADLERNAARLALSNRQLESELSDRQDVEQQLRNANAFLDSVIDNIPTMLFMKDASDLRIVRFNKAGLELVGCSREDLIGKTDFDLYPKEEAEFFAEKDRHVLDSLKMVEIEEEELLTRNGLLILHTKKIPICDEDGKPRLLLGISEDITAKKQTLEALQAAKEAAESANIAKSDFLANMSHEIRTPMNAIIGMTDLVLDTPLEAMQRDYLTIVVESAESLLSIINQILDFSKIEAGKLELESVDFDVREEVGDTLKSLGVRAHFNSLELVWHIHADVPTWLSGDAIRLRQVLVNLVGNAIKFTEYGEVSVDIDCELRDDTQVSLHIGVRDTGIGIAEEKRERIFSAFEQADTSTTREFGGTGLGLAITSSIARAMEGRVWVESVPGEGSTFHFVGTFCRSTETHEAIEFPDLSRLPVLVVDDNETNRHILKEMLEGWGMPVETAAGGPQAIGLLRNVVAKQASLPLVISDVHMPGMDGFMLTEQLRSTDLLNDIIVIMLTSGGREGDVQRRRELGISACLMKPVKQSELLDAIVVAVGGQPESPRSQPEVSEQPVLLPPLKILLAEDGEANQIVAVELLTKWGHTVAVAENGEKAITLWQSGLFDLILMDVQMPILDGFAATRRIRELESESAQRIPIIAMTARAMKGDRERCLAAGMDDYVSKPVRKPELYRAIRGQTDEQFEDYCPTEQDSIQKARPESDNSSATNVIDWKSALNNVDGDRELLNELMQISLKESKRLIEGLDEAIVVKDAGTAERLAHTIKGSAQTIGATETRNAAAAIEVSAAQGDFNSVVRQMPQLRVAVEQLDNAVTQNSRDGAT